MNSVTAFPQMNFGLSGPGELVEWQTHYHLDDKRIADGLAAHVDPIYADLLDVAVAAYVADRVSPRRPKGKRDNGSFWRRRLNLRVAVRRPELWNEPDTYSLVHRLLEWLTDDHWQIEFSSPAEPRPQAGAQGRLFDERPDRPTQVMLFSGGLDSLLGAAADASDPKGELILVAAGTQTAMRARQRELAAAISDRLPRRVRLIVVPVGLTAAGRILADGREEQSQRTRGFVFLSLGAAVAGAAGHDELRVHENGPGALNLPLTPGQQGSMNTRAARPETLVLMQELISRLCGSPFRIVNPAFLLTKGQMCERAPAATIDLLARSVSCDGGFTRRIAGGRLCGTCTSCLLRRQALLAAGLTQVDQSDLEQMPGDGLAAGRRYASPMVLAMLQQAAEIDHAVTSEDAWSALVDRFPELPSARRALGASPGDLADLLGRYAADWRSLPQQLIAEFLPHPEPIHPAR